MADNMSVDAILNLLNRLTNYYPEQISPDLVRIERLLGRLGNPEKALPPVFHVAGTNGKGSTCAFLRAMAEAAGLTVHVFTSPHLVRFNERIRLAGRLITDKYLLDVLTRTESAIGEGEITFFEAVTAGAFLAFSEIPADLLILEVGLGGRLDATNIIPNKDTAVITPIDFDHQQFLGDSIAKITGEKAGIIREGRTKKVITYQHHDEAFEIIRKRAEMSGAEFIHVTEDMLDKIPTESALYGAHQRQNAALACAAFHAWRAPLYDPETIALGMRQAFWPARLQRLENSGPFAHLDANIWLDGGHNPHAALNLAYSLRDSQIPVVCITAMQETKDAAGFFAGLEPLNPYVIAVPNCGGRPFASPEILVRAARRRGLEATIAGDWRSALDHEWVKRAGTLFICGSLYLAGDVLAVCGCMPE